MINTAHPNCSGPLGCLYIVSTPIGNLEDLTFRAVHILKNVDYIAAEDTRRTGILCQHYSIHTPLVSFHENNEKNLLPKLLNDLQSGKGIALVSDAGTPLICDPGHSLIEQAQALGIRICPIPGASALLAALVCSGLPALPFHFMGFLPRALAARKAEFDRFFGQTQAQGLSVIFYEAPHRIVETLELLAEHYPQLRCALARELTKQFESFYHGCAGDILNTLQTDPNAGKGEFVLIVHRSKSDKAEALPREIQQLCHALRKQLLSTRSIVDIVHDSFAISKKQIYNFLLQYSD